LSLGSAAVGGNPPPDNPGESAVVRGSDGKLLVVTGSPAAGTVGVVDVVSGEITTIKALQCAGVDAPPAAADAAKPGD
jgi:hypothetical protein